MVFKLAANRLTGFLLQDSYMNNSVQKGEVSCMPGCVLNMWCGNTTNQRGVGMQRRPGSALAGPSISMGRSLTRWLSCFSPDSSFSLRVSSRTLKSAWQRLEKCIITGCTISVFLFELARNKLVLSAELECRGPWSRSGTR